MLIVDFFMLDISLVYKGLIDSYMFVLDNDMEGVLVVIEVLCE